MSVGQVDRERYEELLQELRVMLPGVEVLFAFLLTAVFAQRFQALDEQGRVLFTIALMTSALTVLLILVPASLHRLADLDRGTRVRMASRFQVAGSVTLGLSMCLALFVVVRFVFGTSTAVWTVSSLAVAWTSLWYVFPLQMRRRSSPRWSRGMGDSVPAHDRPSPGMVERGSPAASPEKEA
jgi:hypothetical protein